MKIPTCKLHPFFYFKTLHIMKRNKDLHCCEVIIKIHVCYTVLHTSEDTVKLLTCFFIQCLHVYVDMWLKCLAAGGKVFTVERICRKPHIWESGWLQKNITTLFQIYQGSNTSCSAPYWNCILLLCAARKPISLLPIFEKAEVKFKSRLYDMTWIGTPILSLLNTNGSKVFKFPSSAPTPA